MDKLGVRLQLFWGMNSNFGINSCLKVLEFTHDANLVAVETVVMSQPPGACAERRLHASSARLNVSWRDGGPAVCAEVGSARRRDSAAGWSRPAPLPPPGRLWRSGSSLALLVQAACEASPFGQLDSGWIGTTACWESAEEPSLNLRKFQ